MFKENFDNIWILCLDGIWKPDFYFHRRFSSVVLIHLLTITDMNTSSTTTEDDYSPLSIPLMSWIVVPQAALGRQCPQLWSTSLASICTVWLCPMFLAVANLKSCSRSTASTVMLLPKLSAKCSAALPMPSNFLLAPPTCITPLQMTINKSNMFLIHTTPSSLNSFTVNAP